MKQKIINSPQIKKEALKSNSENKQGRANAEIQKLTMELNDLRKSGEEKLRSMTEQLQQKEAEILLAGCTCSCVQSTVRKVRALPAQLTLSPLVCFRLPDYQPA